MLVPYRLLELLTLPYTYPRHIPFLPYLNCIHLYNGKKRKEGRKRKRKKEKKVGKDRVKKRKRDRREYISCHLLFLFQI